VTAIDPDKHILAFDVGSSALKVTVFSQAGEILARVEAGYPANVPAHRQDPQAWWAAALAAALQLRPMQIGAIVLTGTMENLVPVRLSGDSVGDALLYSDPCGAPHMAALAEKLDGAASIMGNVPEPLMTAFKLAWLHDNAPDVFATADCFLPGSKDFLALKLTGRAVTDPACAATTGLMDISTRDWSEPLLSLFGIERTRLPQILPATAIIGGLDAAAAKQFGLPPGIPVINGCGDGGATTVGGGAERADDVSLYLGTSGWVARVVEAGSGAPRPFYRLPHPLNPGIIEIAPILSAGAAAEWARTTLNLDINQAEQGAAAADESPRDIVFLPYLYGERSPFVDLDLRGAFFGLSASDKPGDLYYAVLEGVAFAIAENLRAMGGGGRTPTLVGGGALSIIWPQIIADVLDTDIAISADPVSATSFGAFRIAASALGLPPTENAFSIAAHPRPERQVRIARLRQRFAAGTAFARTLK
jgi:xylulokinase